MAFRLQKSSNIFPSLAACSKKMPCYSILPFITKCQDGCGSSLNEHEAFITSLYSDTKVANKCTIQLYNCGGFVRVRWSGQNQYKYHPIRPVRKRRTPREINAIRQTSFHQFRKRQHQRRRDSTGRSPDQQRRGPWSCWGYGGQQRRRRWGRTSRSKSWSRKRCCPRHWWCC